MVVEGQDPHDGHERQVEPPDYLALFLLPVRVTQCLDRIDDLGLGKFAPGAFETLKRLLSCAILPWVGVHRVGYGCFFGHVADSRFVLRGEDNVEDI